MRTREQILAASRAGLRPETDREMDVRQVADLIAANYPAATQYHDPAPTVREWAKRQNAGGWCYDCCYPSQQPYSEGWWSRIDDASLDDDDLETAVQVAEADWAEDERQECVQAGC